MSGMSKEQLERRRQGVGASDVAAILGVDPYRSPADVWQEKVYGVSQDTSEAAELGNYLEDGCRRLAEKSLGVEVKTEGSTVVLEGTPLVTNLDGYMMDGDQRIPVECKTAGLMNPFFAGEEWGDAGTDEVPEHYILQVHAQMMAVGAETSHLSALIGGRGHVMFQIPYDAEIGEALLEGVVDFWSKVQSRTPVSDHIPSMDTLKRVRRVPDSVMAMPGDAADAVLVWKRANARVKKFKKIEEDAKASVIAMLQDCEAGVLELRHQKLLAAILGVTPEKAYAMTAVTYAQQTKLIVDTQRLKSEFPEVYAECRKESKSRTLRLKKRPEDMVPNVAPKLPGGESQ